MEAGVKDIQIREDLKEPEVSVALTTSSSIKELVKAMAAARKNFDVVKKSAENPFYKDAKGKNRKYADLTEIITATADALADQELYLFQAPTINSSDRTVGMETLLAHSSGEWIKTVVPGCPSEQKLKEGGTRYDAQTIGIGFTYMARYTERAILNLGAEDDDAQGLVTPKPEPKPLQITKPGPYKENPSPESELKTTDAEGCPLSDADLGLPTAEQRSEFGKQLKALKQDSRLLKNWVEKKAGKEWKLIPYADFEPIMKELKAAEAAGTLSDLIKEKQ